MVAVTPSSSVEVFFTVPVVSPVTLPVTLPVTFPVRSPVTSPVRSPVTVVEWMFVHLVVDEPRLRVLLASGRTSPVMTIPLVEVSAFKALSWYKATEPSAVAAIMSSVSPAFLTRRDVVFILRSPPPNSSI